MDEEAITCCLANRKKNVLLKLHVERWYGNLFISLIC